jgi:ubiquinone/menaquinone biosynthesis C-methylase UbiE
MEAKLQRRVQRYGWDAAAPIYDAVWRHNLRPAHDAMFEMAAVKPGEAVLDVACGSGFVTTRAAELTGDSGRVLATDISEEMVALTRRRAEALSQEHVTVERGEAESLDLLDGSFDLALCGLGLMYLPEPLAALRHMRQALKPDGRAVVAVWGEHRNCGWAELFPIVDSVVRSEVCPLFFMLGGGKALVKTMAAAGFSGVRAHRVAVHLRFDDAEEVLVALIDGGPVALAAKRFDAAARSQVDDLLLASVSPHRRQDGTYQIPGEFVIAAGVK